MPKGKSPTTDLAVWFWRTVLNREDDPWQSPDFPRYRRESSKALKTYGADPEILRQALLEMKSRGLKPQSIHLPFLWASSMNGPNWYTYTEKMLSTPPPVYEAHAFRA